MKKEHLFRLVSILAGILVAILMAEVGLTLIQGDPADGPLPPGLEDGLDRYLSKGPVFSMYDSNLGWSPLPNGVSPDGLYRYNSAGIRSAPNEYSTSPDPGVLRIALFGDSFTEGAEVTFEDTWGYQLQTGLRSKGINAEVLNFGVSAYGMDQAFLRWEKTGRHYLPDVVVFGFQSSNIKRNMNLFRGFLYSDSGVLFTKPRFVLESGQLRLINVPTVPPEQLVNTLKNMEEWELAQYESFYTPTEPEPGVWRRSRLLSSLFPSPSQSQSEEVDLGGYSARGEQGQLALAIINAFRKDVESTGGTFLVVHLPSKDTLRSSAAGNRLPYAGLLNAMREDNLVVDPADKLIERSRQSDLDSLFASSHYSPEANQTVAEVLGEALLDQKAASEVP